MEADKFRGAAWGKLPLPAVPLVAGVVGPLEPRTPVGEGGGRARASAPTSPDVFSD